MRLEYLKLYVDNLAVEVYHQVARPRAVHNAQPLLPTVAVAYIPADVIQGYERA